MPLAPWGIINFYKQVLFFLKRAMVQECLIVVSLLLSTITTNSFAYRDGARENSCYDHSIDHGAGTETFDCVPPSCPFFLRIREVMDNSTLELYNDTTNTYQCGQIYGIELANTLNDPEGFLIQARNGNDTSSEIIGTFLDPAVVRAKNPSAEVNYKILSCNQSIFDMESNDPLPNSATHPMTVDNAEVLQLYWQAPDCSTCGLGDLRIWFTAVQQLQIVFTTSKVTELRLQNYIEPEECIPTTTIPPTTTAPPTTMTQPTTTDPKGMVEPALSTREIIGLSVGVAVGAIALIILTIVFVVCLCCTVNKMGKGDNNKKKNRISRLWNVEPEKDITLTSKNDSESNGHSVEKVA